MKTTSGINMLILIALATASGSISAQEGISPAEAGPGTSTGAQQASPAATPRTNAAGSDSPKAQSSQAASGDSHVRIVRLSEVRSGGVMLDRGTERGFEPAIQNMPIVEGEKLQTGGGYAEVEFEDDSTLRMTPNTLVEFPQLVLRRSGATASTVKLVKGTMYVNLAGTKGNEFAIEASSSKMTAIPSTHLRLEVQGPKLTLAVFAGSAEVQGPSGQTLVGKKQNLTLEEGQAATLTKNAAKEPYDELDKDENSYHQRYTKGNAFADSPYAYGVSDLNYYGSFVNFAGCGQMWQPYFVNASWSPYENGLWAWYPGAGYSWVSPYPWGWLPFHSGAWSYCPMQGWGWLPNRSWTGLQNTGTHGPIHLQPPNAPVTGRPTLMFANQTPLPISKVNAREGNFEFRNNSAGLGVPRGSLGNLAKVSNQVEQKGFASRPAYATPSVAGGPVTLRSGFPREAGSGGYSTREGSTYRGSEGTASMEMSHAPANGAAGSSQSGGSHSK